MTTVRDLITDSLQDLGAIAINETPSDAEARGAFRRLNRMLQTWQNESLMIYNIENEIFPFVSGQATYTIGTGGDFNTPRPVKIVDCYARDPNNNDYSIYIANQEEYSQIITKYTTTELPTVMYPDGNYPLQNLTFWPIPNNAGWSVNLWLQRPIQNFTSINDVVVLPPGYERAIVSNLAVECAPSYSRDVPQAVQVIAVDSKAWLKRTNTVVNQMSFDPTLTQRGYVFNYLTGNTT